MAQMIEDIRQQLEQVAQPDTERIRVATASLKTYYSDSQCLPSLLRLITIERTRSIKHLAAIEARKQVPRYWAQLDDHTKQVLRKELYDDVASDGIVLTRHASSRVIASIAEIDLPNGDWAELPNLAAQAAMSASTQSRVFGVFLLYILLDTTETFFADRVLDLLRLFGTTMQDREATDVRINSLLALGRLGEFIDGEDKAAVKAFRTYLPAMVEVLTESVHANPVQAKQAFETFQTLLIVQPELTTKSLPDLMSLMVRIGSTTSVEEECRNMALSWILTCIRFRKQKIKSLKLGPHLVDVMLALGAEDDMEAEEAEDCPARLAYRCIDALSTSLPPSHVYEPLLTKSQALLVSPTAGERKAVLVCLGVAIEGAVEYVSQHFEQLLSAIVQGLRDPEYIVQRAALLALGQLSDELPSEVASHHDRILPLVFDLMHSQAEKVGKTAMTALEVLLEALDKQDIMRYLPQLMQAFLQVLAGNLSDHDVAGIVIAAIGSAAHSAEDAFHPYAEQTMNVLLPFLTLRGTEADLELCGTAIDAVGAIAGAVGKTGFEPYLQVTCAAALDAARSEHLRLRECAFVFFAVLSRVLEDDFITYLNLIVPIMISSLAQVESYSTAELDANLDQLVSRNSIEDDASDADTVEGIGVSSAVAMEKEIAADALGELACHTKHHFSPYFDQVSRHLVTCLDHFYEGVRKAAIGSLLRIVITLHEISDPSHSQTGTTSTPTHFTPEVEAFCRPVLQKIYNIIKDEDEKVVVIESIRILSEAVKACGPAIFETATQLNDLYSFVLSIFLTDHACQLDEFLDTFSDDDESDQNAVDTQSIENTEYDSMLIVAASELLVALACVLKGQFLHPLSQFFPHLIKLCDAQSSMERAAAVAGLGEISQALSSDIDAFTEAIFPKLYKALFDADKEVRSNAAYAVGLLCDSSTLDLSQHYPTIMTQLHSLLAPGNHEYAVDNAMGCLARLVNARPEAVPLDSVLPLLIAQLPLKTDFRENEPVYKLLCRLYRERPAYMASFSDRLRSVFVSVCQLEGQLQSSTRENVLKTLEGM